MDKPKEVTVSTLSGYQRIARTRVNYWLTFWDCCKAATADIRGAVAVRPKAKQSLIGHDDAPTRVWLEEMRGIFVEKLKSFHETELQVRQMEWMDRFMKVVRGARKPSKFLERPEPEWMRCSIQFYRPSENVQEMQIARSGKSWKGRKEWRTGRKERRENKVAYQIDDIVQNQSESRTGTWSVEVILEVPLEMAVKKARCS